MTHEHENGTHGLSRLGRVAISLVCVVPVVATLAYGAVDTAAMGFLSILMAVIIVIWIADGLNSGKLPFSTNLIQVPLLGLFAIGCLQLLPLGSAAEASAALSAQASATLSMDPYSTRLFLVRLSVCIAFFALALAYIPGIRREKRVAFLIVVFGALIAFFGIIQRLAMPEAIYGLRETPQAIPFGPFINQHHFAALMEMTSGMALGLMFGRGLKRERKIFVAIAAGVMGMAVIFTGSRGGLISYLAVVGFAAAASFTRGEHRPRNHEERSERTRKLLVIAAAGALVVLVLGSVLFLGGEASLLRGIGLGQEQADVSSGRGHFWKIALQIFSANPILGAGLDAFGVAFTRHDTWNGLYRVEQAHNDYLQILADAGILGFACVAGFVTILVRNGMRSIARHTDDLRRSIVVGAMSGCFGILIHSFFDFPLRTPANALFFLLLVVLAIGGGSIARPAHRRSNER